MRRIPALPLLALLATLASAPLAASARADAGASTDGSVTRLDRPEVGPDSMLGGLAAVGCGFFVRVTIVTAGTQVGTIVGAVACCGYMLFDAFAEPH